MEEGDASMLAHALGNIAGARGMAQIAQDAGIGREALYKALRPGAQPRFDTISRVCSALGVRLVALPVSAEGRNSLPRSSLKSIRCASSGLES